jgi:hypothetical protein
MCQDRILRRLRFVTSRWKRPRQPIKEVLLEAISSVEQLDDNKLKNLYSVAKLFAKRAKEVVEHQTTPRLRVLVEGVSRLWQVGQLDASLGSIPNRVMAPDSRGNLLIIVSKVTRYQEAARFLYRTAKKFQIVQKMKVFLVHLTQDAFYKVPVQQYSPKLSSTIS